MEPPFIDQKDVLKMILDKPTAQQDQTAAIHFQSLVKAASQPKQVSGNSCNKLCYFVELARKSQARCLQDFAFSSSTSSDLFRFYVEWNEKNQHRSMRQVIELLAMLINVNPDKILAEKIRGQISQRLVSIISHQSAQPLVKPAFKAMECLISKGALSVGKVLQTYTKLSLPGRNYKTPIHAQQMTELPSQDLFVSDIFDWMTLPDIAPSAGKMLVTFFQALKKSYLVHDENNPANCTLLWRKWIHRGLEKYPTCLENIKNYLFPLLFKLDRAGSIEFLRELAQDDKIETLRNQDINGQALLFLSAIEVGKKLGLTEEPDFIQFQKGQMKVREFLPLPQEKIGTLLTHTSDSVRSSALSVLVSSVSSIRPFPPGTLLVLQNNLGFLHADTDSRFRNEVLSNSKHMVERLRGAMAYLMREIETSQSPEIRSQDILTSHGSFLQWYLQFLSAELVPTASYQRHITALKAIQQLVRSGILGTNSKEGSLTSNISRSSWPFSVDLFIPPMLNLLLDLLLNPFEDVRMSACSLLKLAPYERFSDLKIPNQEGTVSKWPVFVHGRSRYLHNYNIATFLDMQNTIDKNSGDLGMLFNFIKVAEDASDRTGRADLADGVARAYELLSTLLRSDEARFCLIAALVSGLERKINIAELSLAKAVAIAPVHGQYTSLRLLWENALNLSNNTQENGFQTPGDPKFYSQDLDWNNLQQQIIVLCSKIWNQVETVLCNDSPEGHLLEELEDAESIDTKDILSYSFRAIHESSNLLRTMVKKLQSKTSGGRHLLPFGLFLQVGRLTFSQLSDLRHRGAFSTVSLTFACCCRITQDYINSGEKANFLIQEWYQATLLCIHEQVSTTRRSAGIPALITGVLSANSRNPPFDEVLAELKQLARQPTKLSEKDETALSQVHAMNCLKEIFKSSLLGKRCENHIAECFAIAADSLSSKIWAIRNCGLLLLRSLIDCVFGTVDSKLITETGWDGRSIKLSYDRYPELPELLIRLLAIEPDVVTALESTAIGVFESVFPALDIIRRAGPPPGRRGEIFPIISRHLGSQAWHMRDIAARTVCTLLLHKDWFQDLSYLLENCHGSANRLHGVLLSIRYLLERRLELDPGSASDNLNALADKIKEYRNSNQWSKSCAIIEAAFVDLAAVILKIMCLDNTPGINDFPVVIGRGHVGDILDNGLVQATDDLNLTRGVEKSLFRKASSLCILGKASLRGQISPVKENLLHSTQNDVDTALVVLEGLHLRWEGRKSSPEVLRSLIEMYLALFTATDSVEIHGVLLRQLAHVLEQVHELQVGKQSMYSLELLAPYLSITIPGGPELCNAQIRVSGSLLLQEILSSSVQPLAEAVTRRIEAWGTMLYEALQSGNDFVTRHAAVMSLGAFYRVFHSRISKHPAKSSFVPSILALYDTLNDDDDEIRDAGANIVSQMLVICHVPMAAAKLMLLWCLRTFGDTESFRVALTNRVTGTHGMNDEPQPAAAQLKHALRNDDALFVQEEQNLYIDEVKEILLWNSLVTGNFNQFSGPISRRLSAWAIDGLAELEKIIKFQVFGWTSRPKVFSVFMRIVVAAKTVLSSCNTENGINVETTQVLRKSMQRLIFLSTELRVHPLLIEEMSRQ